MKQCMIQKVFSGLILKEKCRTLINEFLKFLKTTGDEGVRYQISKK